MSRYSETLYYYIPKIECELRTKHTQGPFSSCNWKMTVRLFAYPMKVKGSPRFIFTVSTNNASLTRGSSYLGFTLAEKRSGISYTVESFSTFQSCDSMTISGSSYGTKLLEFSVLPNKRSRLDITASRLRLGTESISIF